MPIPKRAIEVGSGTAVMKLKLLAAGVPMIEVGLISPPSKKPDVVTVNVSAPATVGGTYVKITSLPENVGALGVGVPTKVAGADTGAEKKKSNSPATAPGTEKLPVTVTEAA